MVLPKSYHQCKLPYVHRSVSSKLFSTISVHTQIGLEYYGNPCIEQRDENKDVLEDGMREILKSANSLLREL